MFFIIDVFVFTSAIFILTVYVTNLKVN